MSSSYNRYIRYIAEYLSEIVMFSIKKSEESFSCHVGSMVTDNPDEKTIRSVGCLAHILNLLLDDFEVLSVKERVVYL